MDRMEIPENGLVSLMLNSFEGGGATIRGIVRLFERGSCEGKVVI